MWRGEWKNTGTTEVHVTVGWVSCSWLLLGLAGVRTMVLGLEVAGSRSLSLKGPGPLS